MYRFLTRELGATRLQFIPIVEPKNYTSTAPQYWDDELLPKQDAPEAHPGHPDSIVHDWSVDPDDWGYFLTKVFDDWYRRDIGKVWVYLFESALKQWLEGGTDMCTLAPVCGSALAIEHDGSLFSCDHYVYPEYRLGNIMEIPMDRMATGSLQQMFGLKKETLLPQQCEPVSFLNIATGDVRRIAVSIRLIVNPV